MKIDKEFVLSDSSVNCYGYRLLTTGYQVEEYKKNPIGYYMHDRDGGVLLKWEDIRIVGDKVIAKPNINDYHPRAAKTIDEINNGFLNAASVGHIVVLESSNDPKLKKEGQTEPTITKWYNRECSIVDIPGNFNALSLYDTNGTQLNLSDLSRVAGFNDKPTNEIQNAPILTKEYLEKLKRRIDEAKGTITSNTYYNSQKRLNANEENIYANIDIKKLLQENVEANNITDEQAKLLQEQYQNMPHKLVEALKEFAKLRLDYLMSLSWEELDKEDLTEELKNKYPAGLAQKFAMEFGKNPKWYNTNEPKTASAIEAENLLQQAIKDGDIDPEHAAGLKRNFGSDPTVFKNAILEAIKHRLETLKKMSWDELDKSGELEELKRKSIQDFKQKFFENFGIHYKD